MTLTYRFILVLFPPLLLLLGYYYNASEACLKTSQHPKNLLKPYVALQTKDTLPDFEKQKIGKQTLYTGGMKNDLGDVLTQGLTLKKLAHNRIGYQFIQLENWKEAFEINGTALLTTAETSIIFKNGIKTPIYCFTDDKNELMLYISKHTNAPNTKARVYHYNGKPRSAVLYRK